MIEKYKKENANDVVYHLEYNSERKHLIIPEYGRHLQKLIDQATAIEDKEERNKAAKYIIQVMGSLNPHLRDVPDFQHKLWDQIFIMSDFRLDVDSPYPIPSREVLQLKDRDIIPLKEEIAFVKRYIFLQQIRWQSHSSHMLRGIFYLVQSSAFFIKT